MDRAQMVGCNYFSSDDSISAKAKAKAKARSYDRSVHLLLGFLGLIAE